MKQKLLLLSLTTLAACSSDTSSGVGLTDDTATRADSGTEADTTEADSGAEADTTADDTAEVDTAAADSGAEADTTADDTGEVDTTEADTAVADTGTEDTTAPDTGVPPDRCQVIRDSITAAGFGDVVAVSCDGTHAMITSNTYPDHELMNGIIGTNEQIPVPAKDHTVPIPLNPVMAASYTTIDAALGVAVNGVPIYDYSSAGALDPSVYDARYDCVVTHQLDHCGGHAGRGDDYHYHASPTCMLEAMDNRGDDAIIGWGFDGYPIYGNNNPDGSAIAPGTLDVCNGQPDPTFGYRYHTSDGPPYIIQCLVGEVDQTIIPRVRPLSHEGGGGGRPSGRPPEGGVQNLAYTVSAEGMHALEYDYNGQHYYLHYTATGDNCYAFETKTVTSGGVVETGTYCR